MKVAVVGLGYWGPNHVRNLLEIPACKQVVAVDLDRSRAERVADGRDGVSVCTDLDELIAEHDVRAAVIATPVATHHRIARRLLDAGISVLVEKPLATSRADAQDLLDLAVRRDVLVSCGHTFLHSPPVCAVRDLIRRNELGDLVYLQGSRINLGIHNPDVSVLWDLAPHDLSIVCEWVGESPRRVSAMARSSTPGHPPDVAFLDVEFASGFTANLHLSWLAPTKVRRMTLVGSQKMLVYEDTNSEEPVKIYDKGIERATPKDFGEYRLTYRTGDVLSPSIGTWEPLRRELETFLDRVQRGETPDEREHRVVDIVAAIETAEESLRQDGRLLPV